MNFIIYFIKGGIMKFTVRDLINAGLFSILVLVFFWAAGMIGFMPILMPIVPFFCGLVAGPAFMLYSTKIKTFGMVIIMGIIFDIVFSASGHGLYIFPIILIISVICDFIMKKGEYKSVNHARYAWSLFLIAAIGNFLPILIAREEYLQKIIDAGYGEEYARSFSTYMPNWIIYISIVLGIVGGYLGATIGIKLLSKHFKKAGMA